MSKKKKKLELKIVSTLLISILVFSIISNASLVGGAPKSPSKTPSVVNSSSTSNINTGYENWYYYLDGMVNLASGNLYYSTSDLALNELGASELKHKVISFRERFDDVRNIKITRAYNSFNRNKDGPFGLGWTSYYHMSLLDSGTEVTYNDEDDSAHLFTSIGGGNYSSPPGIHLKLRKFTNGFELARKQDGSVLNFNGAGKLLNITDKNGNFLNFTYDSLGRLNSVRSFPDGISFNGVSLNLAYNPLSKVSSVIDSLGRSISYTYDLSGRLTNVTDALGNITNYQYDSESNLVRIINREGVTTNFAFVNNKTSEVSLSLHNYTTGGQDKKIRLYSILYGKNIASVTGPRGDKTIIEFNDVGNPLQIIDALGGSNSMSWDKGNNMIKFTDANKHTYLYGYDLLGNYVNITDPLGNFYRHIWQNIDSRPSGGQYISLLREVINPRGYSVNLDYDSLGNVIGVDTPVGAINYTYDSLGNLLSVRNPRGFSDTYSYDFNLKQLNITDALGNKTTYNYDSAGRLTGVVDKGGFVSSMVYDANDRLIQETDTLGGVKTYSYNKEGSKVEETDELGRIKKQGNNLISEAESTTDALGNITSYTHDTSRNLVEKKDALGNPTKYEYDLLNRLTKETDTLGNTQRYEYDSASNLIKITDKNGGLTTYEYDALNRFIRQKDSLGNTQVYVRDALGNVLNYTDKNNHTTSYVYDVIDRNIATIDPLGNTESYTYDANGNLLSVVDKNGHQEFYEYDALDRISRITDPIGGVNTYSYDAKGNMAGITNKRNYTTTMTYNALDRLTSIIDSLSNSVFFVYDGVGNVITKTDQRGFTTTMTYDELNRLKTLTHPLLFSKTYSYDLNGNLISLKDENGNTITYTYDELNRLTRESDAVGHIMGYYLYDSNGNLINKTDANNLTTTYTYDALDRMKMETNPLGQATTYNYDAHGNILSMTDANSHTTRYTYDGLDRLTSVIGALGNKINYTYDAAGNLAGKLDAKNQATNYKYDFGNRLIVELFFDGAGVNVGNITYSYDPNDNLIHIENIGIGLNDSIDYLYDPLDRLDYLARDYGGFVRSLNFSYDPAGNRIGVVYPDGSTIAYEYDARNLLISVTDSVAGTTSTQYDPAGRRTNLTLPTGSKTNYVYDAANKMTRVLNTKSSGTLISSYDYSYDGVGNRLSEIRNAGPTDTTLYAYDAANRLKSVLHVGASGETKWGYDAAGNRLNQTNNGILNVTYNYDAENRLLSESFSGGGVTFDYDNNGNLISRTDGVGATIYTYDVRDNLVALVQPDLSQINYKYGPDENRIAKITPNITEYYFHDGDYLIEVLDLSGNQLRRFSYTNFVDEPISMKDNTSLYYYHFDALGSITSITNASEDIIASYKYRPFGEIRQQTGSLSGNPFLFVAREFDLESGLYYFRSRMYNPNIGRFISKDSIALKYPMTISEHTNLYTYVENNPVNFIDPTGMSKHGVYVAGKWYYPDQYDMSSVKAAEAIENDGYSEANDFVNDLNKKRKDMAKTKDKIENALDRAWFDAIFNIAGLIVTIAGIFTANPFIAALGISLTIHHNVIGGASAGDWAGGGVSEAANQGGQAASDAAGKIAGEVFSKASGIFNTMLGALEVAENAEKIGDLQGTLDGLRLADKIHDDAVRSGLFSQMAKAMVDVATAQAKDLAESDKRKDTPTQGGGGYLPPGPVDTPTSSGGGSTGGVKNPGVDVETPGHVDPPLGVGVAVDIKITNTGYENLSNITADVVAFNTNTNGSILLVVDESDGANFWFEQALNDTGHTYDIVFVDTQYTPLYSDDNASTKDLKDYDIVLWEASNDRIGTLAAPAQVELEEYLNNSGCLFVGGEGIMFEWPQNNGTLMSDYMFANGYGMDTFDFNVTGVPGTIGDNLELNLKGGTGSSFENFSSSIFSVKLPGVADFLYDSGVAGIEAIHNPDNISNGTYKSVLFAYDFDSIDSRANRSLVMNRTLEFLNCENSEGGGGGVPTSTPPFFPDDPPDEDTPGIPVIIFPTQATTVVVTPRAVTQDGSVVVGSPSTTQVEVKPSLSVIKNWNFDALPINTCTVDGWTTQDLTAQPPFCHNDTYNAFGGVGQSWWCGQNDPSFVTPPGYGNDWKQFLSLPTVDISSAASPVLSFNFKMDLQPGFDFAYLEMFDVQTSQWQIVQQFSGRTPGALYQAFQMPIDKNIFGNSTNVRFHVTSDSSGSDEDGLYQSDGAFYVDEIQIFDGDNPFNVMYYNNGGDHAGVGASPTASGDGIGNFWNLYAPNSSITPPSPSCVFAGVDTNTGVLPDNLLDSLVSPTIDLTSGPAANCTPGTPLFMTYKGFVDIPFNSPDSYSIQKYTNTNPVWTTIRTNMKGLLGGVTLGEDLGPLNSSSIQFRFTLDSGVTPAHGRGLYVDDVDISCVRPPTEPPEQGGVPGSGSSPIFKKVKVTEP